jgi:hypothetical protein
MRSSNKNLGAPNESADDAQTTIEAIGVIESTILQWAGEVNAEERARTLQFTEKRTPQVVDSQVRSAARFKLGKDLTLGERVALRYRFGQAILSSNQNT